MLFLVPIIAWLVAGSTKFIFNFIRFGKEAKSKIGNGGFPSTHTTIMTTVSTLIGFEKGFNTALFAPAFSITAIIIIDATGIRRTVGNHAKYINKYIDINNKVTIGLRESQGHNYFEVLGGLVLGALLGYFLYYLQLVSW